MIFRNRQGLPIDAEQAEALLRDGAIDVRSDVFVYDAHRITVQSKLQPVCRDLSEPLFLTLVLGDATFGSQEFTTCSEGECRQLHASLVDRYLLEERARQDATPRVLLTGVL